MRAIVPRDVGSYSYAGTGYANPHAVTTDGGTSSRTKKGAARWRLRSQAGKGSGNGRAGVSSLSARTCCIAY